MEELENKLERINRKVKLRQEIELKNRKKVFDEIRREDADMALFLESVALVFGRPTSTRGASLVVELHGKTVYESHPKTKT